VQRFNTGGIFSEVVSLDFGDIASKDWLTLA